MKPLQPVRALAIPTAPRRAAPGRAPNRPTHRRLSAATALLAVLAVSSSCSGRRPNLLEVYPGAAAIEHRPVIIIPGIFGSRLRNSVTGEVVWGRLSNLLTSRFKLALTPARADRSDLLDLPIESPDPTANRDNLEAYDIFDGVAGRVAHLHSCWRWVALFHTPPAASVRPGLMTMIGLRRETSRAADRNARASPMVSM